MRNGCSVISGTGIIYADKPAKIIVSTIHRYLRAPFASIPADTFYPALCFFERAPIGMVLGYFCWAKIGDPIVCRVAVNVVDLMGRPLPVHQEPRGTMGIDYATVNAEKSVTVPVSAPN